MRILALLRVTCVLLLGHTQLLTAQEPPHSHGGHIHGLGSVAFPNSGAPAAQEPFLRGIALLHSFEYEDAADAFRQAQALDSTFALAYWAEALTSARLLWGREDLRAARGALARLAPTPAQRLAKASTPRERAYGAAVEALFAEGERPGRARAWADSLRALAERDPQDLEAAAFASIALQKALAAGGFPREQRTAVLEEAIVLAERVFAANQDHPGAAHYLIHAYDDPAVAHRGLEVARAYARIAPDAPHALHMPSHIFVQVGLWDDVVASNEQAWAASRAAAQHRGGSAMQLDFHSLQWLQYGYLQQGRHQAAWALVDTVRSALEGVDLADSVDPYFVEAELIFRYAAETGRWDTPLVRARHAEIPEHAVSRARGFLLRAAYEAAVGAILQGDTTAATIAEFHATVQQLNPDGQPARGYLAVLPLHLEGLLARARSDREAAITLLARASDLEDEIPSYGPPGVLPTLEWLGKLLLEAGRPAAAAAAYERALLRWPNRPASLLGLARARRAMGEHAVAADAYQKLLANWHQADPDLPLLEEVREGARGATGGSAAADWLYLGQPVPGLTPERFAPGIVSTDAVELNGVFTPDLREFFFARLIDGVQTLHHSVFDGAAWSAPRPLLLFPGRTRAVADDMAVSPDGQELYFLGVHPHAYQSEAQNADIWVSRRGEDAWSTAEVVPPPVSTSASEVYPVVVADGSLYFTSTRPGGPGRSNLYRTQRLADGSFGEPVLLGPPINSEHGTGDTFVAPDESYMILTTNRPEGFGGGDLYVSFRLEDGSWSEPANLGEPINTDQIDYCPMITPDGRYLFFSRRNRGSWAEATSGDVYWVDARILDRFRP